MMNSEGLTSPPQGTFVKLEVLLTCIAIVFEVVLLIENTVLEMLPLRCLSSIRFEIVYFLQSCGFLGFGV